MQARVDARAQAGHHQLLHLVLDQLLLIAVLVYEADAHAGRVRVTVVVMAGFALVQDPAHFAQQDHGFVHVGHQQLE